jgi:hypothetical protein
MTAGSPTAYRNGMTGGITRALPHALLRTPALLLTPEPERSRRGVLVAALANSPVPIPERADGSYRLTPDAIDLRRRREALAFGHAFGMIKERAYLLSN